MNATFKRARTAGMAILSGQESKTVQFLVGPTIHYSLYCTGFEAHLAFTWNIRLKIVVTQSEALVPGAMIVISTTGPRAKKCIC